MKALVQDGQVRQVEEGEFPVPPPMEWIDIPGQQPVAAGWTWNGTAFLPPQAAGQNPPPPPISRVRQLEQALIAKGVITQAEIDAQS